MAILLTEVERWKLNIVILSSSLIAKDAEYFSYVHRLVIFTSFFGNSPFIVPFIDMVVEFLVN